MNFAQNLCYLRKQKNMTQEELAEHMGVSRQTISKWESGASYPEMEKLLQLCDLFGCSLDTLMRGDAQQEKKADSASYDSHMNRFTRAICTGIAILLLGVTAMIAMEGFGAAEALSTVVFLSFVVVAAVIFVVSGIQHGEFVHKHPHIEPFYEQEDIDRYSRRFPLLIAAPIAAILLGVIWLVGSEALRVPAGLSKEQWEILATAVFLLMVALAAPVLVYAGMQKAKYNLEAYNKEHTPDEASRQENERIGKWCGVIMMAAVIAFLLMGFLGNLWHIGWVVFPACGILCGIVSTLMKKTP